MRQQEKSSFKGKNAGVFCFEFAFSQFTQPCFTSGVNEHLTQVFQGFFLSRLTQIDLFCLYFQKNLGISAMKIAKMASKNSTKDAPK